MTLERLEHTDQIFSLESDKKILHFPHQTGLVRLYFRVHSRVSNSDRSGIRFRVMEVPWV